MILLSLLAHVFLLSFMATMVVLNWLAWRRTSRLNALLFAICLQAWTMRHAALWASWSPQTGKLTLKEPNHHADA